VAPVASTLKLAGTVTTGAVTSTTVTVTVKLVLPVFPAASVAEQVTGVAPGAKIDPLAGAQTGRSDPSTASLALAIQLTATPAASVASAARLPGPVTTGAVVSTTVTVKLALPMLPCASVAEHVTGVAPGAKIDPLAGAQTGRTDPSTTSVAEAIQLAMFYRLDAATQSQFRREDLATTRQFRRDTEEATRRQFLREGPLPPA